MSEQSILKWKREENKNCLFYLWKMRGIGWAYINLQEIRANTLLWQFATILRFKNWPLFNSWQLQKNWQLPKILFSLPFLLLPRKNELITQNLDFKRTQGVGDENSKYPNTIPPKAQCKCKHLLLCTYMLHPFHKCFWMWIGNIDFFNNIFDLSFPIE